MLMMVACDGGDSVLYEVHFGGKGANILNVRSGECLVQNNKDNGVLFKRRREKFPSIENP